MKSILAYYLLLVISIFPAFSLEKGREITPEGILQSPEKLTEEEHVISPHAGPSPPKTQLTSRSSPLEEAYIRMLEAEAFDFIPKEGLKIIQRGIAQNSPSSLSANVSHSVFRDFSPDVALIPGDVVGVSVSGQVDLHSESLVDAQQNLFFEKVGLIETRGQSYREAMQNIRRRFESYFLSSTAYARLISPAPRTISVTGFVEKPGVSPIPGHVTVAEALALRGGPYHLSSLRRIIVNKGGKDEEVDLYQSLFGGNGGHILSGGEKIRVPGLSHTVLLLGETLEPGIYEMNTKESLEDLLQLIHRPSPMASKHVHVYRSAPGNLVDLKVLLPKQLPKVHPKNFDLIYIPPRNHYTGDFVTIRGAVQTPGNYELNDGQTLRDLISRSGGLQRIHAPSCILQRRLPSPLFVKDGTTHLSRVDYRIVELNLLPDIPLYPLQASDLIDIPMRSPELSPAIVTIHGEIENPGDHPYFDGLTLKHLLIMAGGTRSSAQTKSIIVNRPSSDRKTVSKTRIDLQNADDSAFPLLPGDQITVPVRKNYGILVNAKGAFNRPGTYYLPLKSRISDLVNVAGGLSEDAYLLGSAFHRKSIAVKFDLQIQELANQLEENLIRSQQASIEGALASQHIKNEQIFSKQERLIERLRESKSPGRVALNFIQFDETFEKSKDNLLLEDGDSLKIPTRPSTISVFGQVFNPNTTAYRPGNTVKDYINTSGGLKKSADRNSIYILKANGFVVPVKTFSNSSIWVTGQRKASSALTQVAPGDSIIVPEDFEIKANKLQVTKDVSQIMFQILGSLGVLVAAF